MGTHWALFVLAALGSGHSDLAATEASFASPRVAGVITNRQEPDLPTPPGQEEARLLANTLSAPYGPVRTVAPASRFDAGLIGAAPLQPRAARAHYRGTAPFYNFGPTRYRGRPWRH